MKFSVSQRETFAVDQYNPGPGYYVSHKIGEDDKINQQKQLFLGDEQNTNWGKAQRFKKNQYMLNTNPGAGTYNPPTSFSTKTLSTKATGRKLQSSEDSLFKVNAIPSIPSGTQVPGYQEIGDGLLILMKEPKKEKPMENVGPTSYNINLSQVKPKIQGFQIKEPQVIIKEEEQKQPQRPSSVTDFLKLQPLNQYKYANQNPKNQNRPDQNQKINKSNTSLNLLHQSKDSSIINSEYNLELLVLREKNLSKISQDNPPPGYYYDPQKETSIKTKKKPIELQCFDSTAPRFQYSNNLNPGVGDYKIISVDEINNQIKPGLAFDKAPKRTIMTNVDAMDNPGVGHYELKFDLSAKYAQNAIQIQQQLSHPSAFGSGSQRFQNSGQQVPGVGSYSTKAAQNHYSEKKKYKNIIMPQGLGGGKENGNIQLELIVQKDGNDKYGNFLQKKFEFILENKKEDQRAQAIKEFNKINDQKSSAFKSEVKRFTEQKNKSQVDVGPGSYEIKTDMKLTTFNKLDNPQIDKDQRKFGQSKAIKSVPKRIGPGTYDYDLNKVRKQQIYDIKIH